MRWLLYTCLILISNFGLYANYCSGYQNQNPNNDSIRTRPLHRPFPDRKDSSITNTPHRPHREDPKPIDIPIIGNRPIRPLYFYQDPVRCRLPHDTASVNDINLENNNDSYVYEWSSDWKSPRVGVSFERHFFFDEVLDNMDYVKFSYTGFEVNNVSLQISLALGSSNRSLSSKLSNIIDGRIKGLNLDIGIIKHFSIPSSPIDYYFIWGGNVEILKWKYHESFETYFSGDDYSVLDNKDGTIGYGLYFGLGIATLYFNDFKLGLEAVPGVTFIPEKTDYELDNILNDLCYMRFNVYVNFDTY